MSHSQASSLHLKLKLFVVSRENIVTDFFYDFDQSAPSDQI